MNLKATLLKPGHCYRMVYKGRLLKFWVHSYRVKSKSYVVRECESGQIVELKTLDTGEEQSIDEFSCRDCS